MKMWVARTSDGGFLCQNFSQLACVTQVTENLCGEGITVLLEDRDHHEHIFRHLENAISQLELINEDLVPPQHEPKTTEDELNDIQQASRRLDEAIQIIQQAIDDQLKRKFPSST